MLNAVLFNLPGAILKQKRLISLLLVSFQLCNAQLPTWQWARNGSGSTSDDGLCVATDAGGNVYVSGYFYSPTISFGSYTLTNNGNYNVYLAKYDAAGNVQWAVSAGGIYDEIGAGLATDNSGNVYLTGDFTSPTLVIGTSTLVNAGGDDIFLLKYDSNGNNIWAKSAGGGFQDEGNGIAADNSGNIYITGSYQSTMIIFGTDTLFNSGSSDYYVAKYDPSGNILWANGMGGTAFDGGNGVSTDPQRNVFVTGSFKSSTISSGTCTLNNSSGSYSDIFVIKYDSTGNTLWAKSAGGTFDEIGFAITTDLTGNAFVTGYYKSSSVNFGVYTCTNAAVTACDIFIVKYDGTGNELWASGAGGSFDDIGYGITCDVAGGALITGHIHSSSVSFSTYTVNCNGQGDAYVAHYDASGNVLWAGGAGGPADDGASSIASDASGNIFMAGFFYSSIVSFGSNTLNNTGNADMFIAKLGNVTFIEEKSSDEISFLLYPNPASGDFKVLTNHFPDGYLLEIKDMTGQTVFSLKQSKKEITIDISDFSPGIYFVRASDGKEEFSKKIIKQ